MPEVAGKLKEPRPLFGPIAFHRLQGLFANRNDALFIALAYHAHGSFKFVQIGDPEQDEFTHAQSGRIKEIEHGAIAYARRGISFRRLQNLVHG